MEDLIVASAFAGLAELIYSQPTYDDVFQALCEAAPVVVDGCDHASLMLKTPRGFVTAAASDDIGRQVDEIERRLAEGPCVDAILEETATFDPDLRTRSPWPALAAEVVATTPVRGAAGFRILVRDAKAGALNLFSDTPGALTRTSVSQGIVLASFASVALLASSEHTAASTLRDGLVSNREIGKAVGLMMAFHKISDAEAVEVLRKASQDMNIKMADVARKFVEHHAQGGRAAR